MIIELLVVLLSSLLLISTCFSKKKRTVIVAVLDEDQHSNLARERERKIRNHISLLFDDVALQQKNEVSTNLSSTLRAGVQREQFIFVRNNILPLQSLLRQKSSQLCDIMDSSRVLSSLARMNNDVSSFRERKRHVETLSATFRATTASKKTFAQFQATLCIQGMARQTFHQYIPKLCISQLARSCLQKDWYRAMRDETIYLQSLSRRNEAIDQSKLLQDSFAFVQNMYYMRRDQDVLLLFSQVQRLQQVFRLSLLTEHVPVFQSAFRSIQAKTEFRELNKNILSLQRLYRRNVQRFEHLQIINAQMNIVSVIGDWKAFKQASTVIQSTYQAEQSKKLAHSRRASVIYLQALSRRCLCYHEVDHLRNTSFIMISFFDKNQFAYLKDKLTVLQACLRNKLDQENISSIRKSNNSDLWLSKEEQDSFNDLKKNMFALQNLYRSKVEMEHMKLISILPVLLRSTLSKRNWDMKKSSSIILQALSRSTFFEYSSLSTLLSNFVRSANERLFVIGMKQAKSCIVRNYRQYKNKKQSITTLQTLYRSKEATKNRELCNLSVLYNIRYEMGVMEEVRNAALSIEKMYRENENFREIYYLRSISNLYVSNKEYHLFYLQGSASLFDLQSLLRRSIEKDQFDCLRKNNLSALFVSKQDKEAFLTIQLHGSSLQALWRCKTKKSDDTIMRLLPNAAQTIIARRTWTNFRDSMNILHSLCRMGTCIDGYRNVEFHTITIQSFTRRSCETDAYIHMKELIDREREVVLLQNQYRAKEAMNKQKSYIQAKDSICSLYSSACEKNNFVFMKKQVVLLQSIARVTCNNDYRELLILSHLAQQNLSQNLWEELKNSALIIESLMRTVNEYENFKHLSRAVRENMQATMRKHIEFNDFSYLLNNVSYLQAMSRSSEEHMHINVLRHAFLNVRSIFEYVHMKKTCRKLCASIVCKQEIDAFDELRRSILFLQSLSRCKVNTQELSNTRNANLSYLYTSNLLRMHLDQEKCHVVYLQSLARRTNEKDQFEQLQDAQSLLFSLDSFAKHNQIRATTIFLQSNLKSAIQVEEAKKLKELISQFAHMINVKQIREQSIILQSTERSIIAYENQSNLRQSSLLLQSLWRSEKQQEEYNSVIPVMQTVSSSLQFNQVRSITILLQSWTRALIEQNQIAHENSVISLQNQFASMNEQYHLCQLKQSIVDVQALYQRSVQLDSYYTEIAMQPLGSLVESKLEQLEYSEVKLASEYLHSCRSTIDWEQTTKTCIDLQSQFRKLAICSETKHLIELQGQETKWSSNKSDYSETSFESMESDVQTRTNTSTSSTPERGLGFYSNSPSKRTPHKKNVDPLLFRNTPKKSVSSTFTSPNYKRKIELDPQEETYTDDSPAIINQNILKLRKK